MRSDISIILLIVFCLGITACSTPMTPEEKAAQQKEIAEKKRIAEKERKAALAAKAKCDADVECRYLRLLEEELKANRRSRSQQQGLRMMEMGTSLLNSY